MSDNSNNNDSHQERKHLHRLDTIFDNYLPPIFFVTMCSFNRRKVLTSPAIANEIMRVLSNCEELHGWMIGRYVIMPDHLHFFCCNVSAKKRLSDMIRDMRKWVTRKAWNEGIDGALWQREFFDHLLRDNESYSGKWEYVRNNPVRAELCEKPEDWPWQGECSVLSM